MNTRVLATVLLTVFLDLVGFGLLIPLLPFYALEFSATALQVTLLMAVYSFAQFLFAPIWGQLSDRYGRRPILLTSIGIGSVMLAGFAMSGQLWQLFLFRILHGACAANISTAQAAVADITPPEKRAMGMGLIGAAFGVGFTLGPFIGGELSVYGLEVPIWAAAGLSGFNFVLAMFTLPETRKPGMAAGRRRTIDPRAMMRVLKHPVVGTAIAVTFLATSSFAMMESTFALFVDELYQMKAQDLGRLFAVAGIAMIGVQGGLIGRLVSRFGERSLILFGFGLLIVSLLLLGWAKPTWPMLIVFVGMAVGNGISSPSLQALISRATPEDEQGLVLGTNQSMSALARGTAPALGGLVFSGIGPRSPFLLGALILLVALVLAIPATRKVTDQTETGQPG